MKTKSYQSLLPITQPLPESWMARLRSVIARLQPCLAAMEPGQSRTVVRVSAKARSVVVVKLSTQPNRCQALALLSADTALLVGTARIQVLHRGQLYEGPLENIA